MTRYTHDRATSHFGTLGTDLVEVLGTGEAVTAFFQGLQDRLTALEDHDVHFGSFMVQAVIVSDRQGSFTADAIIAA
jgi:hypothetical protein